MIDQLKIFVVEDDEWFGKLLSYSLSMNPDHEVFTFTTGQECLEKLHEKPHIITVDYRLPDMDGNELIKRIKNINSEIEVIAISGQEDIETAIELIRIGAFDYIVKKEDIRDRVLLTVNNIRKHLSLKETVETLHKEVASKYDFKNNIIGDSTGMKRVFSLMEKAVQTNITVTISGETGTGKELVAKGIHYHSLFNKGKFVAVNVAAIPTDLVESELFGHEKGAFTGANTLRKGKLEEANNGTLFLDEIGEMDLAMQSKLLRVLQEREFVRVGSNQAHKTNFRLIVATHRNLLEEVKAGRFREDLYYRIFGLPIHLPPLRERGTDILLLAKFFLQSFCKENHMPAKTFSTAAQKKLLAYPYPGNIRELKAMVDLAAALSNQLEISEDEIQSAPEDAVSDLLIRECSLKDYNDKIISHFLKKYDNNIKLVADKLDIGQSTIYKLLKEQRI